MRRRARGSAEEHVLLLLSAAAAGLAAFWVLRDVPPRPLVWTASALVLALSLSTAFALWFSRAALEHVVDATRREDDLLRSVLSAIPDALLVVDGSRLISVNARFCELVGYERHELVGSSMPFRFWPPEHRHELERWHLGPRTEGSRLTFSHRSGQRIPVHVAAGAVRGRESGLVISIRDASEIELRERRLSEVSSRDPETALLNERGFEERVREAVRRAIADEENLSVAVLELGGVGGARSGSLGGPDGLLLVERLRKTLRAGDELGRTRDDEIAWILPDTGAEGAVEAVSRARRAIADLGTTVTAGVCDLRTAGDAPSLYALADRALAEARRQGRGTTAEYSSGRVRSSSGI